MTYLETTPSAHPSYIIEKRDRVAALAADTEFHRVSEKWRLMALERKYMNNFSYLGRPLIQLPTDALALLEIIWSIRPDLIIETGVAHGGSLMLSASALELIGNGEVVGIDIDIRPHNRCEIESHPLSHRVNLIEGSSIDSRVIRQVYKLAEKKNNILVILDSDHTHHHVLCELNAYGPLVSLNSYCIVLDTFIEDMPAEYCWIDRPWGKGNNPKTAVIEWLSSNPKFCVDKSIETRLLITSAPDGFLRRIT